MARRPRRRSPVFYLALAIAAAAVIMGVYALSTVLRMPPASSDPSRLQMGQGAHFLASADLDRDGHVDLITANCDASSISVALGKRGGGFGPVTQFPAQGCLTAVDVGLLDGDEHLDLAATSHTVNEVTVLWGHGDGRFDAQAVSTGAGTRPHAVLIRDMDRDGVGDLAVANGLTHDLAVFYGDGERGFPRETRVVTGQGGFGMIAADLNGDTWLDLVVANAGSADVSVVLGDGQGGFLTAVNHPVGAHPTIVDIGDLDGDGHADLAVSALWGHRVDVLLGAGDGSFVQGERLGQIHSASSVEIVDLDGMPPADLIVLGGDGTVHLYRGVGGGAFEPAHRLDTHLRASHALFTDLDGDGREDLAVSGFTSGAVVILDGADLEL